MWNVFRSLMYQTKRDIVFVVFSILLLVFPTVVLVINVGSLEGLRGSDIFIQFQEVAAMLNIFIALVVVPRISGWDMNDKTINYDVLSGHSRLQVFGGRVLASVTCATVLAILNTAIPVILATVCGGWGDTFPVANALAHFALMILTFIRMCCILILFTFALHNCYAAMLIGYVYIGVSGGVILMLQELAGIELPTTVSAFLNMEDLVADNMSVQKINGVQTAVYVENLTSGFVVETILGAIVVSAILLILGYAIFRRRDLR